VYRRRRVVAMAGTAVGALLFVWAVGALLGGNDTTPSIRGTVNGVPLATTRTQASNPPPVGKLPVRGSATSSPSASPPATTTVPVTTTSAPPPGPPQACPDSVLQIAVTAAQPSYLVGQRPFLTLHITNAGPVACVRDVSRQYRAILLMSADGKTRLWSSGDCYSVTTNEVRTLQPGQGLTYNVAWAGRTSAPGCPAGRTTVPAGTYELVGQLGSLTGPPTPLALH
jgi:hypothetical protein